MNISKFRPRIPIVTVVPNAKAGRLLQVREWLINGRFFCSLRWLKQICRQRIYKEFRWLFINIAAYFIPIVTCRCTAVYTPFLHQLISTKHPSPSYSRMRWTTLRVLDSVNQMRTWSLSPALTVSKIFRNHLLSGYLLWRSRKFYLVSVWNQTKFFFFLL